MRYLAIITVSLSLAFLLGACGSKSGSAPAYTIGGTVSGLEGSGLILQNNDGDDLVISGNGPFTFAAPLLDGANYVVTVMAQPNTPSQTCSVLSGSGVIAGADITNVSIDCGDRYGYNDTCLAPLLLLTTLKENNTASYSNMTLYPAGDQDWYRVKAEADISDYTSCLFNPKSFTFTVWKTPPAGQDYDLEVCYYANDPLHPAPCPSGCAVATSKNSSDAPEKVSVIWEEDCYALDDRYFSIRVYPFSGAMSDAPYSLTLSFQSQ